MAALSATTVNAARHHRHGHPNPRHLGPAQFYTQQQALNDTWAHANAHGYPPSADHAWFDVYGYAPNPNDYTVLNADVGCTPQKGAARLGSRYTRWHCFWDATDTIGYNPDLNCRVDLLEGPKFEQVTRRSGPCVAYRS
jgi:hypothetical protein